MAGDEQVEEPPLDRGLIEKAEFELRFLELVNSHRKQLFKPGRLEESLYRYEALWLPLLSQISKEPDTDLHILPPLDVHWLWHVHLLNPTRYAADCVRLFGRVINHALSALQDMEILRIKGREQWESRYGKATSASDIRFWNHAVGDKIRQIPESFKSHLGYDLIQASARQQPFYYQVSLPHYKERAYIEASFNRYKKFLKLKKVHPETFVVPCFDIDLVWHTHQAHPYLYEKEVKECLGRMLPHDDTVSDRSEESVLTKSFMETSTQWKQLYGEQYSLAGAMFKGNTPDWDKVSCEFLDRRQLKVTFDRLKVKVGKDTWSKSGGQIKAKLKTSPKGLYKTLPVSCANKESTAPDVTVTGEINATFDLTRSESAILELSLMEKRIIPKVLLEARTTNILDLEEGAQQMQLKNGDFEAELGLSVVSASEPERKACRLHTTYTDESSPAENAQPSSNGYLPYTDFEQKWVERKLRVKIEDCDSPKDIGKEVLHGSLFKHQHRRVHVLEVYHKDQLVMLAHTVNQYMVGNLAPAREIPTTHSFLLKDGNGDFAILNGWYENDPKEKIMLDIIDLRANKFWSYTNPENNVVIDKQCNLQLNTGSVSIKKDNKDPLVSLSMSLVLAQLVKIFKKTS